MLPQRVGLLLQLGVAAAQLHEDRHLGAQHLRHDRLEQEIDRAQIVTAEQVLFIPIAGEEKNRDLPRSRAAADQLGGFKAVHLGHSHVQQDGREIVVQKVAERLLAGVRQHQFFAQTAERRLQRHKVLRCIVHQKNLDPAFHGGLLSDLCCVGGHCAYAPYLPAVSADR